MAKNYDDLAFTDDYMFCKVLTLDPELCKDILELLLDIKIRKVRLSEAQKSLEIKPDSRGVRFDVYVEDENNTVFDIEMQTSHLSELPKRSRYYQGMIDLNMIKRGAYFSELRKSYVIFICLSDPFESDLPIYTFENISREDTSIRLNDEAVKVFINAGCRSQELPVKIKEFFDYLTTRRVTGELTSRIEQRVRQVAGSNRWRTEYMTLELKHEEIRRDAFREGEAQGIEQGKIRMLNSFVKDGIIGAAEAARRAGMTLQEYLEEVKALEKDGALQRV